MNISNFRQLTPQLISVVFSLIVTSYLFVPRLFDINYKHTLYPVLAFPFACVVFSSLLLGSSLGVRVLKRISRQKRFLINRKTQFEFLFSSDRKRLFISLSISLALFFLYLLVGLTMLEGTNTLTSPKLDLFGADVRDWVNLQYFHDGYKPAHTNILLIVQPLESLLEFFPLSKTSLAIILNSFFSSLCIFLSSILFWQLTQRYISTFLLALLLGLTTSHVVFGSIPESYTLGCCSLITTYILFLACLKSKKLNLEWWVLAGIFSFGITITNFSQTLICFIATLLYLRRRMPAKECGWMILEYVGAVVSCSIFLSILQNKMYGSDYFFMPNTFVYEAKSFITKINLLTHPFLVIGEVIKHFFLVNVVATNPSIINSYIYTATRQLSFFGVPLSYSFIGFVATLLWGNIFIVGAYHNIILCITKKDKERAFFLGAVSLSILFNMIFHSLYGTVEMFIYTCYFTFLVVVLFINDEVLRKPLFMMGLGLLISLMAINNLTIFLSFKGYAFVF